MSRAKSKFVKKHGRLLKKPDAKKSEFSEAEHKLNKELHENEEGLGIDKEEESEEEAYPEIDENLWGEDSPDKENDEE